jgi:hypothetical protein
MNPQDRYRPVGRWVREVTAGLPTGPKRFIYDADVAAVIAELGRRHPTTADRVEDGTAVRYYLYKLGPDHPALVEAIALDLHMVEVKEA